MAGRDNYFMSIGEVAAVFGVSRLRVREAIAEGLLEARRDNEGCWRVHCDTVNASRNAIATRRGQPAASTLIEILFDEVEELQSEMVSKDRHIERLDELLHRQHQISEYAVEVAERKGGGSPAQVQAVADRAIELLESAVDRLERNRVEMDRMTALLDRAFDASDRLEHKVAEKYEVIESQYAQIERLLSLVEERLDTAEAIRDENRSLIDRLLSRGRSRP